MSKSKQECNECFSSLCQTPNKHANVKSVQFFIDNLDGVGTIFMSDGNETESVITYKGGDEWFYPEDLRSLNYVLNVFGGQRKPKINTYKLPDNWFDRVTKNNGKDGKPSIHDLMEEI